MVSLSQNSSGKQEGGADGKEKIEARKSGEYSLLVFFFFFKASGECEKR